MMRIKGARLLLRRAPRIARSNRAVSPAVARRWRGLKARQNGAGSLLATRRGHPQQGCCRDVPQQTLVEAPCRPANQRSRGLQLARRGVSATCTAPATGRGALAR